MDAIADKESFWDYIGTNQNPVPTAIAIKYYPELVGQAAKYGIDRGLLHFDGGRLKDADDDVWDTRDTVTHFSGKGWAIFVVSPEGYLYGGTHKAAKHHHSSFLAAVWYSQQAKWHVIDGIPRFITAKSGHYAPNQDIAAVRDHIPRYSGGHVDPAQDHRDPGILSGPGLSNEWTCRYAR